MGIDKEKEILNFATWFLNNLSERCVKECGRSLPAFYYPVFKKFLTFRIKRELEFYKVCVDSASLLTQWELALSENSVDDVLQDSVHLDRRLTRDIAFLPVRVHFDYDKILPLRKERTKKQVHLFMQFLSTQDPKDYDDMVAKAIEEKEFFHRNNELLELYADEAFIVNSSLKSVIHVDSERIAEKMHCSMLDIGIRLNVEITKAIYACQTGETVN